MLAFASMTERVAHQTLSATRRTSLATLPMLKLGPRDERTRSG